MARFALLALMVLSHACVSAAQSTPDSGRDAKQRVLEQVPERLNLAAGKIRVVGEPIILPQHAHLHRMSLPPAEDSEGQPLAPGTVVHFDAGAGDRYCGHPRALVRGFEVQLLDGNPALDKTHLSFTAAECEEVAGQVRQFFRVLFDIRKGPERFEPFVAEAPLLGGMHFVVADQLPAKERRRLMMEILDFGAHAAWLAVEEVPIQQKFEAWLSANASSGGGSGYDGPEFRQEPAAFLAEWDKQSFGLRNLLKDPIVLLGSAEEPHFAAVSGYLEAWLGTPIIHKKRAKPDEFPQLHPGTLLYHFENGFGFIFMREEGRLKLLTLICPD